MQRYHDRILGHGYFYYTGTPREIASFLVHQGPEILTGYPTRKARVAKRDASPPRQYLSVEPRALNPLMLPPATTKQNYARQGDGAFRNDDREVGSFRTQAHRDGQPISKRNFEEPESEQVDPGRRDRIAGAVERLQHDHAVGVADVAVAENAQAAGGERNHLGIVSEQADDRLGEEDHEYTHASQEQHVVEAGAPDGSFGTVRLPCPEILADERGGGVAQSPGWQDHEDQDADRNGVAGECSRAEGADDSDQRDPTGVGDRKLQDAGDGDADEAPQDHEVETKMVREAGKPLRTPGEAVELVENTDASSDERGEGRASHAQAREGPEAEDEAGIED